MRNTIKKNKMLRHMLLAVVLVLGIAMSFTYAFADEATGTTTDTNTAVTSTDDSADPASSDAATTDSTTVSDSEADSSANNESSQTAAVAVSNTSLSTTLAEANGTSYTLYWYALIPGHSADGSGSADDSWYGLGTSTIVGTNPAYLSIGTSISDRSGVTELTSFPDITYNGVTYHYAATGSENASKEGYYTLADMRIRVADGANSGNNKYNPVVNSGTHTYHFDHTMVINSADNYASVIFEVKYPGESSFATEDSWSHRVKKGTAESAVVQPVFGTPSDFTETRTVDGVTYVFDGWYTDEACTQKADFTGTITGTTYYYGHYVAQTGSLTISKTVAGDAANTSQYFTFELSCSALANKTYGDVAFNENGVATIKLKHGESKTIEGLPAGQSIAISETGLSGNAKTSTTVTVTNSDGTNVNNQTVKAESSNDTSTTPVSVKIAAGNTATAAFTNNADLQPNTGLNTTNSTPMIALFGAAAAGGLALAVTTTRKRNGERKES